MSSYVDHRQSHRSQPNGPSRFAEPCTVEGCNLYSAYNRVHVKSPALCKVNVQCTYMEYPTDHARARGAEEVRILEVYSSYSQG